MDSLTYITFHLAGVIGIAAILLVVIRWIRIPSLMTVGTVLVWIVWSIGFIFCVQHEGGRRFLPSYVWLYAAGIGAAGCASMGIRMVLLGRSRSLQAEFVVGLILGAVAGVAWCVATTFIGVLLTTGQFESSVGVALYSIPVAGIYAVPSGILLEVLIFFTVGHKVLTEARSAK